MDHTVATAAAAIAQARVLLRLGRPVDVAERGLMFVQNFLAILAAREAAGQIKPWFKEVGPAAAVCAAAVLIKHPACSNPGLGDVVPLAAAHSACLLLLLLLLLSCCF